MAAGLLRPSLSYSTAASLLKDPTLLSFENNGGPKFSVYNPANPDEVVGEVPLQTRSDATQAIERSASVLSTWRDGTTTGYRASLLTKWSGLIKENREDLATIITLESGKPLAESRKEVSSGASFLEYYAAEAIRPNGFLSPTTFSHPDGSPRGHIMAVQKAVGVVGLITPWNFPINMIMRKSGPALAAGCTAVIKPSDLTPLTALAVQNLAQRAGFPENVIQLM